MKIIEDDFNNNIIYSVKLTYGQFINETKNLFNTIDTLFELIVKYNDDDLVIEDKQLEFDKDNEVDGKIKSVDKMFIVKTQNNKEINNFIESLSYPIMLNNYKVIKSELFKKFEVRESNYCFKIFQENKLVLILSKIVNHEVKQTNLFSNWFSKYGYNICIKQKMDTDHMFPFSLDLLLNEIFKDKNRQHYIKLTTYLENNVTYMYFYGKLLKNGEIVYGRFKYFVDSNNVLFHRMFREKN